ncbi:MAG: hybrid sensor histidine kinase/response regulator [Fibrobacteres bacterium]|nr:hybrid sensor histidine kinase/response regulator [Fibrobacterota bacterium]
MVIADRTPVDVLITDIRMPGMNGFELAHLLRQSRPGLPILFISGYFDSAAEEHMEWIQRPKVGFLPKPFPPGALLRNLELLLAS